jgi:hypothetical protein
MHFCRLTSILLYGLHLHGLYFVIIRVRFAPTTSSQPRWQIYAVVNSLCEL